MRTKEEILQHYNSEKYRETKERAWREAVLEVLIDMRDSQLSKVAYNTSLTQTERLHKSYDDGLYND